MGHDPALTAVTAAETYALEIPFEEYLLGRGLSRKTATDYLRELRFAAEWFQTSGVEIAEALPSQLVEYAATRPNTPGVRGHMRAAFRYWWEWRGVRGWPDAIKLPTVPMMTCKALEDDDAARLLEAAHLHGWRAGMAVEAMLFLGLRNKECASMRWDGFDTDREWYTLVGKNSRQRTLPVDRDFAARLFHHRGDSPWVFEGRLDGHVSHQAINNWVKQVSDTAGIKGRMYSHRLRHTTLAIMNDDTKDLRTTQEFAGHARPETTAGYTRTSSKRLRSASDAVTGRLRSTRWLHASLPSGSIHLYVGSGDEWGSIHAVCDPPGEDDNRPFCWSGPDRFDIDHAIADARAHAPQVEPVILDSCEWPDPDTWIDPLTPATPNLAEVIELWSGGDPTPGH